MLAPRWRLAEGGEVAGADPASAPMFRGGEHTGAQGAPLGSADVQENLCGCHPVAVDALWVLHP